MINRIHIIIKLAACFVGCFFICACENDMKEIKALSESKAAVETGLNIETIFSIGGKLKAVLTAPVMNRHITDSAMIVFPNSLHVVFYDTTKQKESDLSAKYARYYENQNMVYLRDSVVVFNVKGDTLKTEELYWDQMKAQFHTDKPVRIIQQGKPLLARKGLISDQSFSQITMFDPVGTLPVADSTLPQ